jgi:hypothetical protein
VLVTTGNSLFRDCPAPLLSSILASDALFFSFSLKTSPSLSFFAQVHYSYLIYLISYLILLIDIGHSKHIHIHKS